MKAISDSLYIAWFIGTKDIVDALKNKSSRNNIIIILFMVIFFYWLSDVRPFDKNVSVVVYDESNSQQAWDAVRLANGSVYSFRQASSLQDMQLKMANQNLALVYPADASQTLNSTDTLTMSGYIFWVDRTHVTQLEAKYSQAFTEILRHPAEVVIGNHILIPAADADGQHVNVTYLMIYFVFTTALLLIPNLMLEEKQTKTMDALMISPATPGQIVLGKALAGFFYTLVVGGVAMALFSAYIVNWIMAVVVFLGYAIFAVGLGLLVGSFIKSMKHMVSWMLVLLIFLIVPPLFQTASNLKEGIRQIFTVLPTSALASLFRYSCSSGYTLQQVLINLAIVLVSIGVVFAVVTWKVMRSNR
jgi:ABC-2 type transport system permease protein